MGKKCFFILISMLLISSVFADTNGIWTYAKDIVPGTFGSDEGYGPFTFNGMVNFLQPVNLKGDVDIESNLTVNGRSFFKDEIVVRGGNYYLVSGVITLPHIPSNRCPCDSNLNSWECGNKFYANGYSLPICYDVVNSEEHSSFFGLITHTIYTARVYNYHEAINVTIKDGNIKTSNITLANKLNCSKLYTDANGNVWCGVDQVNDADADPTNELQNLYSVLKRGNSAGGLGITNVKMVSISNAGEVVQVGNDVNNPSIELRDTDGTGLSPYIDFSNDHSSDYDMRLTLNGNDELDVVGGNLKVQGLCLSDGCRTRWQDILSWDSLPLAIRKAIVGDYSDIPKEITYITCESQGWDYKECTLSVPSIHIVDAYVSTRYSRSSCVEGSTYGIIQPNKIWVDEGCRAKFKVLYLT